ncbi:MAG: F0F1 ATP synthase subunit B [Gemmatimonadales bacterium]
MLTLLALAAETGGPASPFEVNFGLFFWTWVVFGLLFVLLKKFAWPSILRTTEERERAIAAQLAETERNRAESARLLEEHKKLLAEGRSSAHQLLVDARNAAEKERQHALEKTKQEQEELLERARREIATERDRAVEELRREAVDLSLAAAGKLIGERLGTDTDRKLVESYLASLEPGR